MIFCKRFFVIDKCVIVQKLSNNGK